MTAGHPDPRATAALGSARTAPLAPHPHLYHSALCHPALLHSALWHRDLSHAAACNSPSRLPVLLLAHQPGMGLGERLKQLKLLQQHAYHLHHHQAHHNNLLIQ